MISESLEVEKQSENETTEGVHARFEPDALKSLQKFRFHTSSATRLNRKKVSPIVKKKKKLIFLTFIQCEHVSCFYEHVYANKKRNTSPEPSFTSAPIAHKFLFSFSALVLSTFKCPKCSFD